jgi:hypothetical protein
MRIQRITTVLLASALLGLAPVAPATGTAWRDPGPSGQETSIAAGAPDAVRSKPARRITERMVQRHDKLFFLGNVGGDRPVYRRSPVVIQRKVSGGTWRVYRTVRTNARANYQCRVPYDHPGRWYFRAKVKASKNYRTSFSDGHWYTT